jgi:hypothetical protein
MKKYSIFAILALTVCLSSCQMLKEVNASTSSIRRNRMAVECSTQSIERNRIAVEHSTEAIERNIQALDKVTGNIEKMEEG